MTDESRAHRWRRLIREEREAFEKCQRNAECDRPSQRENLAREWFAASARLLQEHMTSHIAIHEGGPLEPYPCDAIGRAFKLMQTLSTGNIPQPVWDITAGGGHPNRWPGIRQDLATAVDYIRLAKAGEIEDRKFIKTVAEAFQVDRTTVHGWCKDSERICDGFRETPAKAFPRALRIAGARYHYNRTGKRTKGVE